MVRQRLIRDEAPLPDDAILVRLLFDGHEDGSAFNRARLIGDATLNFTEFGYYGLSMWGAVGARSLESVLTGKCKFSRWVALYRAADLRDKGLASSRAALRRTTTRASVTCTARASAVFRSQGPAPRTSSTVSPPRPTLGWRTNTSPHDRLEAARP